MASYLPSADHPDYAAFEASYPDYRKNLEARYPQVCLGCEPRVRARIRAAGYVAKTDHLRRMIEHTRGAGPRRGWQDCGWRGVLIFLGGLAWWGSLLGNVVWHVLGTTAAFVGPERIHAYPVLRHVQQYVQQLWGRDDDPSGVCTMIQWSLILGVASIWWNTQLMAKLRRSGSRLTGLNEYYKLQVATMVVRAAAWWVLRERSTVALEPAQVGAAHFFMLLFVVSVSLSTAKGGLHSGSADPAISPPSSQPGRSVSIRFRWSPFTSQTNRSSNTPAVNPRCTARATTPPLSLLIRKAYPRGKNSHYTSYPRPRHERRTSHPRIDHRLPRPRTTTTTTMSWTGRPAKSRSIRRAKLFPLLRQHRCQRRLSRRTMRSRPLHELRRHN